MLLQVARVQGQAARAVHAAGDAGWLAHTHRTGAPAAVRMCALGGQQSCRWNCVTDAACTQEALARAHEMHVHVCIRVSLGHPVLQKFSNSSILSTITVFGRVGSSFCFCGCESDHDPRFPATQTATCTQTVATETNVLAGALASAKEAKNSASTAEQPFRCRPFSLATQRVNAARRQPACSPMEPLTSWPAAATAWHSCSCLDAWTAATAAAASYSLLRPWLQQRHPASQA